MVEAGIACGKIKIIKLTRKSKTNILLGKKTQLDGGIAKTFTLLYLQPRMRSAFSAESRPVSTRMAPIELLLPIGWALPYACDSPVLFAGSA